MRPQIFHIFDFPVPAYGFTLALSFLLGIWMAARRAERDELNPNAILDLGILILVAVVLGSRLYYAVLHPKDFPDGFLTAFNPFRSDENPAGGLVLYGGLIGGMLAAYVYLRAKRLSFPRYADAMAPGIALGVFLTRIGCFLNGCCHGSASDGPLAVTFPPTSAPGRFQEEVQAAGLHPSQLYESFGGLVLLVVLLAAGRTWSRWHGLQFYLLIVLYTLLRFMVEFTRHFGPGEMIGPLTHNQIVCLVLFSLFGFLTIRSRVRG